MTGDSYCWRFLIVISCPWLAKADIITMHLPKTKETAGLFDAERLARAKDGVVIVNAARGGLIVEDALVDALKSG